MATALKRERYKALHAKVNDMGKLCLAMMRCPTATKEDIWNARQSYYTVYQQWIAVRVMLQEKHPPKQLGMFPEPWNKNLEVM